MFLLRVLLQEQDGSGGIDPDVIEGDAPRVIFFNEAPLTNPCKECGGLKFGRP